MIYGRNAEGRFFLRPDADGDLWHEDWPVMMIDGLAADAYARWLAEVEGLAWRLPCEMEWEKAARGVDRRVFPWGNHLDASWVRMRSSHSGRPTPAGVESYPVDSSPYGVRGLGGNVQDWCVDVYTRHTPEGPRVNCPGAPIVRPPDSHRVVRGGSWINYARYMRATHRFYYEPTYRNFDIGFRLVRSYP